MTMPELCNHCEKFIEGQQIKLEEAMMRRGIPLYMQGGIERYMLSGVPASDFLNAVFSNDLMEAYARADDLNGRIMRDYAMLLYNDCPAGSFGSKKNVKQWVENEGLAGMCQQSHEEDMAVEQGG
jgi:hypothetical protein